MAFPQTEGSFVWGGLSKMFIGLICVQTNDWVVWTWETRPMQGFEQLFLGLCEETPTFVHNLHWLGVCVCMIQCNPFVLIGVNIIGLLHTDSGLEMLQLFQAGLIKGLYPVKCKVTALVVRFLCI